GLFSVVRRWPGARAASGQVEASEDERVSTAHGGIGDPVGALVSEREGGDGAALGGEEAGARAGLGELEEAADLRAEQAAARGEGRADGAGEDGGLALQVEGELANAALGAVVVVEGAGAEGELGRGAPALGRARRRRLTVEAHAADRPGAVARSRDPVQGVRAEGRRDDGLGFFEEGARRAAREGLDRGAFVGPG